MKISILFIAASMVCFSPPVLPADSVIYTSSQPVLAPESGKQAVPVADAGTYIGVGISDSIRNVGPGAPSSNGLRLIGGYDFNKYFGIEAGYFTLGTFSTSHGTYNSYTYTQGTVKSSAFTMAVKGTYKFHTGISFFGELGLASVKAQYNQTQYNLNNPAFTSNTSQSKRSTGWVVALGWQYFVADHVGFRLYIDQVDYEDGLSEQYTNSKNSAVTGVNLMALVKF
jgi:Outer membrane protein beta-barrel domain